MRCARALQHVTKVILLTLSGSKPGGVPKITTPFKPKVLSRTHNVQKVDVGGALVLGLCMSQRAILANERQDSLHGALASNASGKNWDAEWVRPG